MSEEYVHERSPPTRLSLGPFESDLSVLPSDTSDPSTLTFDMDIGAGDPNLPPLTLGLNIDPPQPTQGTISPNQHLCSVDTRSALELH
jgi:hypothetical protein